MVFSALLAILTIAGPTQQQGNPFQTGPQTGSQRPARQQEGPPPFEEIKTSVTRHTVDLPSGPMSYTATAEQVPLRSDTGEVECRMFCVSYTKEGGARRPVTFAFNGGPGSATIWLHMGAIGPKRAPMNDDGTMSAPPYSAIDNKDTWLDFSDLVLIDAPATGFSRMARRDLATKYFGVRPDIAAFTTFVRNWLTEHHRWNSPIFIAGESYGGIRGSGLSNSLFRAGIGVCGFVSISGTSNFMTLDGMRGNDVTYLGFLPSMAACAWYHHKLSSRFKDAESVVKEVEAWCDKEYGPALLRGGSLSDAENDHIAAKLSEYLGLSKQYCLGSNNRVTEFAFFTELLRDQRLQIGRLDGRITGKNEQEYGSIGRFGFTPDPSDEATSGPFTSAFLDYADRELGVHTDMGYNTYGDVQPWTEDQGSYSETSSDLRNVLARDTHFKVLYCCGYYDLACPFNATIYTVNHMGLDKNALSRVSYAYYPAGHMMYIEKNSRKKLHDDVKAFEASCLIH